MAPDRQILSLVATIVEGARTKTPDELGCLRLACKIQGVAACQNAVEQAQMRGDGDRQPLVRARAQPKASASVALRLQPRQELLIVGQGFGIQRYARRDVSL